jgi:hypothetical protein
VTVNSLASTGPALAAIVAAVLAVHSPAAAGSAPTEYEVKAAFLYNFSRFVEWPRAARPAEGQQFVVAVLGRDPFGPALEDAFAGKTVLGQRPHVRRVATPEEAARAHIVFVSSSEKAQLGRVLAVLGRDGVLTVGDMDGFARSGGIIGFRLEQRRVRFDINPVSAAQAGLRVSSELLKLARIVSSERGR